MGLISIGEFGQASRLSPKALRLYDELGLLVPARVDPETGYRWYEPGQLERARKVALLRRIGVPLARIRQILERTADAAAAEIADYWAGAEAEHAARRELAGTLVNELTGKTGAARMTGERSLMYEIEVQDLPERRELSLIRRMHQDELVTKSRELFIRPLLGADLPRLEGVAGAPFMIFHGEVSGDSDGPVEWCMPVPADQAEEIAARFPDLTLRTEPAHQEAFIRRRTPSALASGSEAELALQELRTWAVENRREASGGIRMLLVRNPANGAAGPDTQFTVPLR